MRILLSPPKKMFKSFYLSPLRSFQFPFPLSFCYALVRLAFFDCFGFFFEAFFFNKKNPPFPFVPLV